jgi:hypothetical protein
MNRIISYFVFGAFAGSRKALSYQFILKGKALEPINDLLQNTLAAIYKLCVIIW